MLEENIGLEPTHLTERRILVGTLEFFVVFWVLCYIFGPLSLESLVCLYSFLWLFCCDLLMEYEGP